MHFILANVLNQISNKISTANAKTHFGTLKMAKTLCRDHKMIFHPPENHTHISLYHSGQKHLQRNFNCTTSIAKINYCVVFSGCLKFFRSVFHEWLAMPCWFLAFKVKHFEGVFWLSTFDTRNSSNLNGTSHC